MALPCWADTVTLKSGEVLNGTVVHETDEEILMDVTVGSGISDQKKIAKADVASVTKTTPDEAAYEPLKNLAVGPRSLALAGYDPIVKSLEDFLAKHPQSAHAADVKAKLDAFKQDQARVKVGELKWNNRWYTPEEIEKNKYTLGSEILFSNMKDQAARRDFIGALNSFDTMEKSYPGARVFPDAVELAQAQLRVAASEMERLKANAKFQEDQFNRGLQLVGDIERMQMQAARKAQVAAAEAQLAAAEKAQIKWKPVLPLAPKSFDTLKNSLPGESSRINQLPVANMRKSLEATDAAEAAAKAQKNNEANAKLKEAGELWKANAQIEAVTELIKKGPKATSPAATNNGPAGASVASSSPDAVGSASATPTPGASPTATPAPKWKQWLGL